MKNFANILTAYQTVDGLLAAKLNAATAARDRESLRKSRTINDHSFFILLFAQFEDEVNTKMSTLVQRNNAANHWAGKSEWEKLKSEAVRRIPFEQRCKLLLDPTSAESKLVIKYYGHRNEIAHKGISQTSVVVPLIAADLQRIAAILHSN